MVEIDPGGPVHPTAPDAAVGYAGVGHPTTSSEEAPAFLWLVVFTVVVLWWLRPWLHQLLGGIGGDGVFKGGGTSQVKAAGQGMQLGSIPLAAASASSAPPAESATPQISAGSQPGQASAAAAGPQPGFRLPCSASVQDEFDLVGQFEAAFAEAIQHLTEVLAGPPSGEEYMAAIAATSSLQGILDKVFQASSSPEDLAKVCRLNEASGVFAKHFGRPSRSGHAAREMLRTAGFERQEEEAGVYWVFRYEDAATRLRGLTVRLCLQKSSELQRLRGPGKFIHTNNDAVIPEPGSGSFAELVELYRGAVPSGAAAEQGPKGSARERNFENSVRCHLNLRRQESGCEALVLCEALAAIARKLADAQRKQARLHPESCTADSAPPPVVTAEVRDQLAALPLPPGASAALLHWSSGELPRLFGLADTTRSGGGPDESDAAADILAKEAVGYWAVRRQEDAFWPSAALCGVGAALDYTVNRGFAVALLLGYEDGAVSSLPSATAEGLRNRREAAKAAAAAAKSAPPPRKTPWGGGNSGGPRVHGFGDISKRGPPRRGGG